MLNEIYHKCVRNYKVIECDNEKMYKLYIQNASI